MSQRPYFGNNNSEAMRWGALVGNRHALPKELANRLRRELKATSPSSQDIPASNRVLLLGRVGCGGWLGSSYRCDGWMGHEGGCCTPHKLLLEYRYNESDQGDADSNPRPEGVGTAKPPIQLLLTNQAIAPACVVIPTGNPYAQFLVRLFAKTMGVRFFVHFVSSPNSVIRPYSVWQCQALRKVGIEGAVRI